ncbi:hypothetical protein [Rubinisphaera margarita]|uniref:hypothetical protein n=1 Tax=Rubinisphaera margarita TaxID=2909586 RepID=UPI001EE858C6|nr:hypothetical protein [Rubinisphaera margarita]MCG6157224.1 hypothetical protein [Rubinisphaera margarita]
MSDTENEPVKESPGVLKLICGSAVTLGVAITAAVTSLSTEEIAVGITAWVAATVIGASAMIAAFRQS